MHRVERHVDEGRFDFGPIDADPHVLPFAREAVSGEARAIKASGAFVRQREEILSMIWEMEEQIMGGDA